MALLTIISCLDPLLRKKCQRVDNIDDSLITITEDMIETMYDASGLGLAANQIGLSSNLFVIDVGIAQEKRDPAVIINPVITASEDEVMGEEGCLSIPDIFAEIKRAQHVEVKGYDLNGNEVRYEAEGILARAFQHEMDHLQGGLFWDNLSKVKRDILKRKFKKKLKELQT
ncbi:MAG TPA: peptide deformylase [Nitrospinaceae bacterium]|jgi:peptide deformylase|nr:peptide deformylase [Nitrospinaceae bacterium]HJL72683.1 peptide deformylase [Nitrospinaceae bacterium]HJO00695.1 peptide deformylase [Nitrospinaceae bacterium]|tara:strand:+ start:163 stop:675 length:513 start_codon:yes stop_codon:yes gene_type:complete